jgi:hypothetical protein
MRKARRDRTRVGQATAKRKRPARRRRGLAALIGLFASSAADLAARHDDYLYGWKKPAS